MEFISQDGCPIVYDVFEAKESNIVMQLIHGSIEHRKRYYEFANYLKDHGITVYLADLRGHGESIQSEIGVLSLTKNGWDMYLEDIVQMRQIIEQDRPNRTVFLYGHSMGSLIVRTYLPMLKEEYQGVIISGTGSSPKGLTYLLSGLVWIEKLFLGKKYRSRFLHNQIYEPFNKSAKKMGKPGFVSSDPEIVKQHREDPLCRFTITIDYANELARGVRSLLRDDIYQINPKIPLLFVSGELDPVGGDHCSYVKEAASKFEENGNPVTLKIYPNMMHEMHNEVIREEVYSDYVDWIKKQAD